MLRVIDRMLAVILAGSAFTALCTANIRPDAAYGMYFVIFASGWLGLIGSQAGCIERFFSTIIGTVAILVAFVIAMDASANDTLRNLMILIGLIGGWMTAGKWSR